MPALPEEPEAIPREEDAPRPAPTPEEQARALRVQSLGLVLLTALALPLVRMLESWLEKADRSPLPQSGHDSTFSALHWTAVDVSLLCVLAYALFRQGRSLRQLGLTARWSELPWGLALALVGVLPWALEDVVVQGTVGSWLVSGISWQGVSVLGLLSLLGENLKLQIVLSAYVITELRALSGSALLTIAASVGLQALYLQALYLQLSLAGVVSLLLFSLFYWRTRRATPLLLGSVVDGLWFLLHSPPTG